MTTPKLACPQCGEYTSKVIESRPKVRGFWRRRKCTACGTNFQTEETRLPLKSLPKPHDSHNI